MTESGHIVRLLSKETQRKIINVHIAHYDARLTNANRHVNVSECSQYLALWNNAAERLSKDEPYVKEQLMEFTDLLYSGDCNELLTPEELVAVNKRVDEPWEEPEEEDADAVRPV